MTSLVRRADDDPSDAPKLRLEPPPPLRYTGAQSSVPPLGCFLIGGVIAVAGVLAMVLGGASLGEGAIFPLVGIVAILFGLATQRDRRRHAVAVAELDRFRREALVGRATVETISAGSGRAATLGLKIEITGQPDRHLEHDATIPELLVPRLVEGLSLPVIVERDQVEVQWHLV